MTEPTRIRICRTHNTMQLLGHGCAERFRDDRPCDLVCMVWSSDGSALLAVDACADCTGRGLLLSRISCPRVESLRRGYCQSDHFGQVPCPKCGGRGWVYRAATEHLMCGMAWPVPLPDGAVAVVRL